MQYEVVVSEREAGVKRAASRTVTTCRFSSVVYEELDSFLMDFLRRAGMSSLFDPIAFCYRILCSNAEKASIKRIYFMEKGLNPYSRRDYRLGMESFWEECNARREYYLQKLKSKSYGSKVVFLFSKGIPKLLVKNRGGLFSSESKQIREKFLLASQYRSIDRIALDTEGLEGPGLGLLKLLLTLKDMGLPPEKGLQIRSKEGEITATLSLVFPPQRGDGVASK